MVHNLAGSVASPHCLNFDLGEWLVILVLYCRNPHHIPHTSSYSDPGLFAEPKITRQLPFVVGLLEFLKEDYCLSFAYILVVQFHRQFEMVIPTEDSVITEMTSTLRDWGAMWKQLYVVRKFLIASFFQ